MLFLGYLVAMFNGNVHKRISSWTLLLQNSYSQKLCRPTVALCYLHAGSPQGALAQCAVGIPTPLP